MITTCAKCGGLRAEPGEMFAGKGCECPLPPATCYVASWQERSEEMSRYGLLLGALKCVSWQVEPELRKRIESALSQVEPHNAEAERPAGRKLCDSQQPERKDNANQ